MTYLESLEVFCFLDDFSDIIKIEPIRWFLFQLKMKKEVIAPVAQTAERQAVNL